MRFLIYSYDGLELGHTKRHCAIAAALTEFVADPSILMASDTDEVYRLGLPACVEVLKMPSLRGSAKGGYVSRRMGGLNASEIRAIRSALLLATVRSFKPDVVLAEQHPLGTGGEFKDALLAARSAGARTALGFRDILDDPSTVAREWSEHNVPNTIEELYDAILIFGDPSVFDPVSAYEFSAAMTSRTQTCGYVMAHPEINPFADPIRRPASKRPFVLASARGGDDGFALLRSFLLASRNASWTGGFVKGSSIPEDEFKMLQQMAGECGAKSYSFLPDLASLFGKVDALVCMGEYNTMVDVVSVGLPAVCVPRTSPRKDELIRAKAFERLGLLKVICPESLTADLLRDAVDSALAQSRGRLFGRAQRILNFDGARQAARYLLALAAQTNTRSAPKAALSLA